MIVIVDSGIANVRSVANMLRKAGADCRVSREPSEIRDASRLVLPGIGHFDAGMRALGARGLREVLDERALVAGVPVLGICLGMQLLGGGSDEGREEGLGWLEARSVRFRADEVGPERRVPHMGWAQVRGTAASRCFTNEDSDQRFYFVHSYHLTCANASDVVGTTVYGREFVSAVQHANIMGVQFHPEKSHRFGLELLAAFARYGTLA